MAQQKRDYYEVLGISRSATDEDIKKAFRQKAMQYHPDRNKEEDANEKFKECAEAYEVLSDASKRAAYDRYGHASTNFGAGGFNYNNYANFDFGNLGDIFEQFFGGATSTSSSSRKNAGLKHGQSITMSITLDFEEAALGAEKEIEIKRDEHCSECGGSGARKGTSPQTCPTCSGSGEVYQVQRSIFGQFKNAVLCNECNGRGKIINDKCPVCRGNGVTYNKRKLAVKIPAGVFDGSQVRLSGEGYAGPNGSPSGHAYLNISVKSHKFFEREGDDIIYEMPINFAQAALGDEIEVPTLYGSEKIKVPAGTPSGKEFRLKGKGVASLNGGNKGDQLVYAILQTPKKLSDEQKNLLEKLAHTFKNEK
ncbi:MAG: molecular chaperone DnaJ [Chloroflexi bacterium]|nr:molecular chaperone DnaJ [Chloroflexota bacterium]